MPVRRQARGEAFVVHIAKCNLDLTVRLCFSLPAVEPKGRRGTDAEPFTDTVHGLDVRSDTERRRYICSKRKSRLGESAHIDLRALDKMG